MCAQKAAITDLRVRPRVAVWWIGRSASLIWLVSTSAGDVDLARYFAPVDLVACESEERVLRLNCGTSDSDWKQVKLEIAPSDVNGQPLTDSSGNAVGWERCSVQGGGCLSPQRVGDPVQSAVWLLFPLIGLGGLARRRD